MKAGLLAACFLLTGVAAMLPAQEQPGYVRLTVANPPAELPSGRTIVALSRLLDHRISTGPTCGGQPHLRAAEGKPGIRIDSAILSSTGPFPDPDPTGCGYGRLIGQLDATSSNDTLILGPRNDAVDGGGGNDRIDGREGDNVLAGGAGDDVLLGGAGNDRLEGGEGNDRLFGGEGNDSLEGGAGDDILEGMNGDDSLEGGDGKDTLFGGDGNDILRGGAGDDVLEGEKGDDQLLGGKGNDEINGGEGDDTLHGGEDNDKLSGDAGNDTLLGGGGNDILDGGDGSDTMDGGPGDDALDGGDDPDLLSGGDGNDTLQGEDADDTLLGGNGNDRLLGGDGNDLLRGGAGDDLLDGGDEHDTMLGENGADRLLGGEGNDSLSGGAQNDTLVGDLGNDLLDGGDGDDVLDGGPGDDVVLGGAGVDRLTGGTGVDVVNAGAGDDTIILRVDEVPSGAVESIEGGAGKDVLVLTGFSPLDLNAAGSEWVLTDPVSGGKYRITGVEEVRYTQVISYLGNGGGQATAMVFTNPSGKTAASGRIDFLGADGKPLPLVVNGKPASANAEFTIPPLGSTRLQTDGAGAFLSGTATVTSDRLLGVDVRAPWAGGGMLALTDVRIAERYQIPILRDKGKGATTGVILRSGAQKAKYDLSLATLEGGASDDTDVLWPAQGQVKGFVEEYFSDMGDMSGVLWITGPDIAPVAVQRAAGGNEVHVLPGQAARLLAGPPPPNPGPGKAIPLAYVTAGNNASTAIIIWNQFPIDRPRGTVEFFGADGKSVALPIEGHGTASSVPYNMPPRTRAVIIRTSSQGNPMAASARIIPADGAVDGSLQYHQAIGPVAGTGSAVPLRGFIAPVGRNSSAGRNTRVAVTAADAPVTLALALRQADGSVAVGGNTSIQLPAGGQIARDIDQLFPEARTEDFEGVVTVSADGGAIYATVLQRRNEAPRLAAAPVTPLQ